MQSTSTTTNRKQVFYQDLMDLLKEKEISNLDVYETDQELVISNTILNFSVFTYFSGLLISCFMLFNVDLLKVAGLILALISLARLYLCLIPIKTTKIDFANQMLTSISLFGFKTVIPFDSIVKFTTSDSSNVSHLTRYEVIVEMKSEMNRVLFDVANKEQAVILADYLTSKLG